MIPNQGMTDNDRPATRFDHLEAALEKGHATIHQLLETHFGQRDWNQPDATLRSSYAWYEPQITDAFEKSSGRIADFYSCTNIHAAVLLTADDDVHNIHLYYDVGQCPEADELLAGAHRLATEAIQYLNGKDLRRCLEMIFDIANGTLGLMNQAAQENPGRQQILEVNSASLSLFAGDLTEAQKYFNRAVQRRSQIAYFWGMTAGLLIPGLVGSALAVAWLQAESDFDFGPLIAALGAGAVGAWISVIQRMASSSLRLDYSAGFTQLLLLGLFRPVVGAVFGAALYFVIESEVLPLSVQSQGRNDLFFFIAVGFFAGFQERWAQDMLSLVRPA
jgi:hypothetical protein